MGKLDLHIGSVYAANDAVLGGVVEDSTNALRDSVYSIINTVSESGKVLVENTINLTRHPINTIFSVENWKKLFKTPFIVGADVLMKAKALPFATMDKAMQYIINNNLERIVFGLQAGTSQALANWITSNGETGSKTLKVVGSIAEDIGDLAGDIVKVVPGIAGLGLNKLNKYVGNLGVEATNKSVKGLRVNDKNYINAPLLQNTSYVAGKVTDVAFGKKPAANDDNYALVA